MTILKNKLIYSHIDKSQKTGKSLARCCISPTSLVLLSLVFLQAKRKPNRYLDIKKIWGQTLTLDGDELVTQDLLN